MTTLEYIAKSTQWAIKKRAPKLLPITLAVIDRFWQNLHCCDRN